MNIDELKSFVESAPVIDDDTPPLLLSAFPMITYREAMDLVRHLGNDSERKPTSVLLCEMINHLTGYEVIVKHDPNIACLRIIRMK